MHLPRRRLGLGESSDSWHAQDFRCGMLAKIFKAESSAGAALSMFVYSRLYPKSSTPSLPVNNANMRVVEIVIDGFKSYAVRTVISGWDESFNSITGLNGSGKSNILDAICFVLGITSMSTVRAQNIQVSRLLHSS